MAGIPPKGQGVTPGCEILFVPDRGGSENCAEQAPSGGSVPVGGVLNTFPLPAARKPKMCLPQIYLSSFKLFQLTSRTGYFPAEPALNPPQMEEGRPAAKRAGLCLLISSETSDMQSYFGHGDP